MNAIVSVTDDWGIGYRGALIVPNRADMRRFVRLTGTGTVVMGRRTFESLPGGPLKGRRNVVVTTDPAYGASHEGVECVASPEAALAAVSADDPQAVWLIGGERLYRRLLDCCERCHVTRNRTLLPADAFFPDLDTDPHWELEGVEEGGVTAQGVPFDFATYRNLGPVRRA